MHRSHIRFLLIVSSATVCWHENCILLQFLFHVKRISVDLAGNSVSSSHHKFVIFPRQIYASIIPHQFAPLNQCWGTNISERKSHFKNVRVTDGHSYLPLSFSCVWNYFRSQTHARSLALHYIQHKCCFIHFSNPICICVHNFFPHLAILYNNCMFQRFLHNYELLHCCHYNPLEELYYVLVHSLMNFFNVRCTHRKRLLCSILFFVYPVLSSTRLNSTIQESVKFI